MGPGSKVRQFYLTRHRNKTEILGLLSYLRPGSIVRTPTKPGADVMRDNGPGQKFSGATCSAEVSSLPVKTCHVVKIVTGNEDT